MEKRYSYYVDDDAWGRPEIWIKSGMSSPDDLDVLEKFLGEKFNARFYRKIPDFGAEMRLFKIGREKFYILADEVEGIGVVALKEKSRPTMETINEALRGKVWMNPDESISIEL